MAERRCGSCRFWGFIDEIEPHDEFGECRRHAPVPFTELAMESARYARTNLEDLRARWRMTKNYDWCGEHMPKIKGGE